MVICLTRRQYLYCGSTGHASVLSLIPVPIRRSSQGLGCCVQGIATRRAGHITRNPKPIPEKPESEPEKPEPEKPDHHFG